MREDFLYFLWKFQLFEHRGLTTQCGQPVQIKKIGFQNHDAGPDFSAAQLIIGDMEWFGNVEMHTKSSEWFIHKHQHDAAYDSVVLHIVWKYNMPVTDSKGREIPTIELAPLTNNKYLSNYEVLNQSLVEIPCQERLAEIPSIYLKTELDDQVIHRLERKTDKWKTNKTGELKTLFYELLAQSFGFKVNTEAFYKVAQQLPLSIILKHRSNLFQLEALLFGVAGMLSPLRTDEYAKSLKKEWSYLQHKYKVPEVTYIQWKYAKMRPPNFPTIKIAQFAVLMTEFQLLFDAVNTNQSLDTIKKFFQSEVSSYWKDHYVFDKLSIDKSKVLGVSSFHSVVINAIIPFVYLKFKREEHHDIFDYLTGLLESLPPEKNHKVALFRAVGVKPKSAFDTQGLLELLDYTCLPKKCLSCRVGNYLVR